MKQICPKNIATESHDAVIEVLEVIEFLLKLDDELKLEDHNSFKYLI